ncbi:MAG: FIVAR domain-containing protein [[Clostridium] spiroforme]|uniref:FIVAR domain-containing protein n=1 Tax=Thomasclavelia spiroformis TaxID=29348 RepID=A0A943I6U6_9FIRM|nr:metallophosphoesterase [Thomasclavelia spiroformis]MBS5588910.1 FIVAR domain-containing protein [Thomasclavelia spiroformis]
MKKQKSKVLKVSMATLALLMGAGYVADSYQVMPAHADTIKQDESTNLINASTTWKYLDNNVDPGTSEDRYAWTKEGYQVDSWKSAAGKFGAKNGALGSLGGEYTPTVLLNQYIEGTSNDIPTFFFRTTVNLNSLDDLNSLTGNLYYDDATIIYINGIEVASFDKPSGGYDTNMSYGGSNDSNPREGQINLTADQLKDVLKVGENVIAVELHQGRANSSDVYFEFANLQVNYGQTPVEQKALNLTVGKNETEMNLTWYANTSEIGTVEYAKASENGDFPSEFITVNATGNQSNDNSFYYNQATLTNLEENTKYVYRLVNGETVSKAYEFTTEDFDGSYNFILAGDPQIGASGNAKNDTEGWKKTLQDSINKFDPDFILSAGDQVNTASNESQYSGYLASEYLTNTPQANVVGNHDSSSNAYSQHFNLPNVSGKGATTAGSDYWYVYNNTLFMNINSNNMSTAEHKAFMEEAIAANPAARWKVVSFHHSVYSVASHAVEGDILQRREELTPVFDDLGIDVVLMGHDHVYVRSNIMKDMQVVTDTSNLKSVTDPDGVLYVTANSASGSKYYNIKTNISTEFVAKMDQSKQRSISNIEVSENEFKITTYLYDANNDDWAVLDTFAINKTEVQEADKTALKIAVDLANAITDEDLTNVVPAIVDEFIVARDEANTVYNNASATQVEVNNAFDRLASIMQKLEFFKGDKTALKAFIDKVSKLDSTKYTETTWTVFNDALITANSVYNNVNAMQEEVNNTYSELVTAFINLRLIPNKDLLEDLINQAEGLNSANYTEESYKVLNEALVNAKAVFENPNASQVEVNSAKDVLEKAINSLENTTTSVDNTVKTPVNKGDNTSVKTGDNSSLIGCATLLFTALGSAFVGIKTRKNKQEN